MGHPFIYVGCFIKLEVFKEAIKDIRSNSLENDIKDPHITFAYKPEEVDQSLFGKNIRVRIVGYGNDGKNEGVKVQLFTDNEKLQPLIDKIEVPHITIAVGGDGKPVDTKRLTFRDVDPIEITGKYGGYAKWGKVVVRARNN